MSGVVLSGAIPGLILPGATVTWGHFLGVVVATGPDLSRDVGPACAEVWVDWTARRLPLSDLALHMNEAGRDRCVRWLRERGHDLRWAEDEAEVLAWSVLSVARGVGPIKAILPEWTTPPDYHGMSAARCAGHRSEWLHVRVEPFRGGCSGVEGEVVIGWEFWPQALRGAETGSEGRAAADRAALAAGYALRNDDGTLTLPPLPEVTP